ncbi:MAG: hypothetical protein LBU44_00340 [Mediterranea sp.]|jgi:hypothetical protein|nr:hypothetical protein [Mediterranea sp.]
MKKSITSVALFVCILLQQAGAQNAINFTAVYPDNDGLGFDVKEGLKQKVEQIIGRNNAGATSIYNAFIIQPGLDVQDTKSTEGLVRNVTLVTGELTLTAKNLYDESIYGTLTISLEGDATGNREAALKALLKNIKITNPAFTRFIRTTREKIMEHYMENCQTIMTKAQTMISTDKIEEAMGYLGSVPEVVPCYEDISSLMTLAYSHAKTLACDQKILMARSKYVMGDYETALELLAEVPSSSTCREDAKALTDSIAKYIHKVPDTVFIDRETIVEVENPAADEPVNGQYRLNVSCLDLGFDLISCEGHAASQSIILYCRLVNKAKGADAYIHIYDVIDGNGAKYTNLTQSTLYGCSDRRYISMPTDIPVAKCFVIKDLTHKLDKLAYVAIEARNCKIELRDVPVTWNK